MYIFDSNTFIQAKNLFYRFNFCSGYWDWLIAGANAGKFYISASVDKELKKKEDEIKVWLSQVGSSFILPDMNDQEVLNNYSVVVNWANNSTQYTDKAKMDFSNIEKADAFLIALGMKNGFSIVTHEKSDPHSKKKIFLPDAASNFGVNCVALYDVLNAHALPTFQFDMNAAQAKTQAQTQTTFP